MTLSYDLTTEDGLLDHLKANGRSEELNVKLLSGGTANYVYRVTSNHGVSSVFKHAAPYLHSNRDFAFDPTRMDYEARALEILSTADSESPVSKQLPKSTVHAVHLLGYDKVKKLMCIEDGGSQNLKDAYDDSKLDIPNIGGELGNWIAALHICSKNISLALSNDDASVTKNDNNPIAVQIYRYMYNNLHDALSRYGHDTMLADRINAEYGSLLETDNECICHGDYWSGNVLIRVDDSQKNLADLTIVDWEMVRRGTSATDVGQFAAEAFLLDRFRGGRGLLPAFLKAYAAARESDGNGAEVCGKTWLRRMVVHWAVHVTFWPTRVEWTGKKGTQQLVDIGVGVLKDVLDGKWEKLLGSPLLKDMRPSYAPLIARP